MNSLAASLGAALDPDKLEHLAELPVGLFDLIPAAVYLCGLDGTVAAYNVRAVEFWGREPNPADPADRFGASRRMFHVDGSIAPIEENPIAEVLRTGIPVRDREVAVELADGTRRIVCVNIDPVRGRSGSIVGAINCFTDITERKHAEAQLLTGRREAERRNALLVGQKRILEMIATEAPAADILAELAGFIEAQEKGLRCGILIVTEDGKHFRRGAGPNLPETYHEALDGVPITPPYLGVCGEAAHLDRTVVVPDIAKDDRWSKEWRDLVLSCGLASVRSTPVHGADGRVLASFAMYYGRPRDPSPADPELIEIATYLTGIVLDRERERQALRESEERFRSLVDGLPAAIYTTDAAGRITYYNQAATRLWGTQPELGKNEFCGSWKLYWPDGTPLPHDECPMALALREKRPNQGMEAVAERPDGSRVPFLPFPVPLLDQSGELLGGINMLVDITERKESEKVLARQSGRLEMLNRVTKVISSDLDLDRIVQAVTDEATEATGAKFGAFFYNAVTDKGESYTLYTLSGVPREAFERFPLPRNTAIFEPTFRGVGVVRSDDIRADPRFGKNAPYYGMPEGHLPVVSYLAVPVVSRSGEVYGGLFFGHERKGVFTREAEELAAAIAGQAAVALDNARLLQSAKFEIEQRQQAQERQKLLIREMNHRVKNLFALASGMVSLSARSAETVDGLASAIRERLSALSHAHRLTLPNLDEGGEQASGSKTSLHELLTAMMAPYNNGSDGSAPIAVEGADVEVAARPLTGLALLLHEFATNAAKYGALSVPTGRVRVQIAVDGEDLRLTWVEQGGPAIAGEPESRGFGTSLERGVIAGQLQGRIKREWDASGLTIHLAIPLRALA